MHNRQQRTKLIQKNAPHSFTIAYKEWSSDTKGNTLIHLWLHGEKLRHTYTTSIHWLRKQKLRHKKAPPWFTIDV
jgi:hypothetical protein